jgi:hypothetical protein
MPRRPTVKAVFRAWLIAAIALPLPGLATGAAAAGAPRAAELGPEVTLATPAGGFVGRLTVTPAHGPAGTPLVVRAEGLPAGETFALVWRTVKGNWKVADGEYHGREYTPAAYRLTTVTADGDGRLAASFIAPEDFGFAHDIVLQQGTRLLTQTSFNLDMTMRLSPESGPVGTPIRVDIQGIGWRQLQNSWLLLYDNNFTGWISSVSTGGSASFTIPATGKPGLHVLEVLHGDFTFPYRNMQQSPEPDRPRFALPFRLTPGDAILPPPPEQQVQASIGNLPTQGELVASPRFSTTRRPALVQTCGVTPGQSYELNWSTVTGNRVGGRGWEQSSRAVAQATADASGRLEFRFDTPGDLGGAHEIWIEDGATRKTGTYWIAPTAFPLDVGRGPAGTTFKIRLSGVGWTETANIYTVVYDNNYIGYACGFNSQGDVEITLHATGEPGWHFVDLYPAIYKGREARPINFRLPQLTYAADHPGEDLPRFRFAFEVTDPENPAPSR